MIDEKNTLLEIDEQSEKQWYEVNDKDHLLAEKLGFNNVEEYKAALRRIKRIEALVKQGATRDKAIEEVNNLEMLEARQERIDKELLEKEQNKRRDEFLARYVGDFNELKR
tara:strand:- start:202 stop:534 length:333 start_codon:yes stop_codon:yes gene_type:complete